MTMSFIIPFPPPFAIARRDSNHRGGPGSALATVASWSIRLWEGIDTTRRATFAHSFLTELTNGTLDLSVLGRYVNKDVFYLRDYARGLAVVGEKAPSHSDTVMIARHAGGYE